ncbi:MAG: hypothetical protein HYZ45_02430, partial [Burkholderiales bacterium]|nr:hypothetical protein [Burkholderiales bacterium]
EETVIQHISQKKTFELGNFLTPAISISEEKWNQAFELAVASELPKVMFDRHLMLATEKVRFTIEYLPRLQPEKDVATSAHYSLWEGPVVVKAHFRGKSQALLQIGTLDGGPFNVQVDLHDGLPAIQITSSPHYNNGFKYFWSWDDEKKRFLRLGSVQEQGC